jgi:enoyl-CoA hydratase
MAAILRSVNEGLEMTLEEGLEHESKLWGGLAETEDIREGVTSFVEKRRPKFQDK